MDEGNFEKVLERISKHSGIDVGELERRIEAKRARLSGLISREGAAQVLAAELGLSFDQEKVKLNELLPGMRKVIVTGKVIRIFPVRTFEKKGQQGKVANLILADDTTNVRVVFWDVAQIALIERGEIKEGSVIELLNASVRDGELHLGSFSEVKLSSEVFDKVETSRQIRDRTISECKPLEPSKIRAFVVQAFEPKFFNVCPECKRKLSLVDSVFSCAEHGTVQPLKRALLNVVLDDGTESIRSVIFHDHLTTLGINSFDDFSLLKNELNTLLGHELFLTGSVKQNMYLQSPEFVVDAIEHLDLDTLIKGFSS